jgi:phosphatidylglycerol:prolipoprotein diacylglycerol transferase
LALSILLVVCLPIRRQQGDVAGLWLMGTGIAVFITEFWRAPEGRGSLLGGAINGPQVAAVVMVLAGAVVLRERKGAASALRPPTSPPKSEHEAANV